jgi:hypothetical protein
MSTTLILAGSFVAEVTIIAIGLAIYFYRRFKNLKENIPANADNNDEKNIYDNLKDIFDEQIKLTKQQVAKYSRGESSSGHRKIGRLLSKRIEFLELEKDVSSQEIKDQPYWKKLCERMAGIIAISDQEESEEPTKKRQAAPVESAADAEGEAIGDSVYRKKILRYQTQIMALHQDFEDYRKSNKRLVSLISSSDKDDDADSLMKDLLEDIKEHDDRLHANLSKMKNDNERLQEQLNDSEKSAYKLDYDLQREKQKGAKVEEDNISTAAEQEISKLREIIGRQYGSLDELKQAMANSQNDDEESQLISQKLEAVEKSQAELQTCIEVLEMDNDRLVQALEDAREAALNVSHTDAEIAESPETKQKLAELYELRLKSKEHVDVIDDLTKQLEDRENKITTLSEEFASLQDEFMRIYEKQNEA